MSDANYPRAKAVVWTLDRGKRLKLDELITRRYRIDASARPCADLAQACAAGGVIMFD